MEDADRKCEPDWLNVLQERFTERGDLVLGGKGAARCIRSRNERPLFFALKNGILSKFEA